MKHSENARWFRSLLIGLGLASTATCGWAAPDLILGTFDSDLGAWGKAWGSAAPTFDPGQDSNGNGGGAAYITGDFSVDQNTLTVYGCNEGNPWWGATGANFNMSDYKSVEFDIKWDASAGMSIEEFNSPSTGGSEGGIVVWAVDYPGANKWPTLGSISVPAAAADGWVHISVPIDPTVAGIDPSKGIVIKKWVTEAQKNVAASQPYAFWVDNVYLKGGDAPPPPPTVSLDKPVPGLALIAAGSGQWDRQNIRTVGEGYSWIGASGPVTYSATVSQFPGTNYAGFQLHMYFTPGTPDPTRSDPDWHEPNILTWVIGSNAEGGSYSSIHYKTNAPDDNGILFGAGAIDTAGSASSPLGTWKLTFENNTQVTVTSPTGETVVTNLPSDLVPVFDSTMKVYVGIVPGSPTRLGQQVTLASVKFEGMKGADKVDSNFVGQSLDTNVWEIIANSPNGVQTIPTDAIYWVDWTLPATGFSLIGAPDLLAGPWKSPPSTGFDLGTKHRVLLRTSDLPGSATGYWRLVKRTYSKLQVLLPGETAAPGTATGKTGTPTAQTAGVPFDITVNAVDEQFNLVTSATPMVTITSTDEGFFPPANAVLAGGTRTFNVTLSMAGDWTLIATDTNDSAKAGTSGTVKAQ